MLRLKSNQYHVAFSVELGFGSETEQLAAKENLESIGNLASTGFQALQNNPLKPCCADFLPARVIKMCFFLLIFL